MTTTVTLFLFSDPRLIEEMVAPACLVILSPLLAGTFFGVQARSLLNFHFLAQTFSWKDIYSILLATGAWSNTFSVFEHYLLFLNGSQSFQIFPCDIAALLDELPAWGSLWAADGLLGLFSAACHLHVQLRGRLGQLQEIHQVPWLPWKGKILRWHKGKILGVLKIIRRTRNFQRLWLPRFKKGLWYLWCWVVPEPSLVAGKGCNTRLQCLR